MTTVSTEVIVRDSFGRFIADVEGAATKSIIEALNDGVDAARGAAPQRTGRLRSSFFTVVLSRTSGVFANNAPYAMAQDQGARPHHITPHVSFFWEREGREWIPPQFYWGGHKPYPPINHPGNPATHFMDTGYRRIQRKMPSILKKHYPG